MVAPSGLLIAATENIAAWHEACIVSIHGSTAREPHMWSNLGAAPGFYLAGIALGGPELGADQARAAKALAASRSGEMAISDTWSTFDLSAEGFERDSDRWFLRPPGPVPSVDFTGTVERISTPDALAEFEDVHHRGFEVEHLLRPFGRFGCYGQSLLKAPGMHLFGARNAEGTMVSVGTAMVAGGIVGIYGVATPPEYRRMGYAAAVTRACIEVAPELPAMLVPSTMGESVYRRLGFEPYAETRGWIRRSTTD